jgi:hypothetical protein
MALGELLEAGVRIAGATIAEYILHPVGVLILRMLSLGRYPPRDRDYNHDVVSMVPLVLILVVVAILYS